MEPDKDIPEPKNTDPYPPITEPNIPADAQNLQPLGGADNLTPAPTNESFRSLSPSAPKFQPDIQPPEPSPSLTDSNSTFRSNPVDTSQLFQPDTKLPEVNSPLGNMIVDNRPPKGLKRLFRNKKLSLLLASQLAVVLLVIGGVFGYYLPNRPNAVWKTGLNRTGMAMDKLINSSTEKDQLNKIKKSEINGSLEVTGGDTNFKGSFSTKYDTNSSNNALDVKYKYAGSQQQNFNVKLLSSLPAPNDLPDLYFQITGIRASGADAFVPGLSDYDGKWIGVSSDYLKSVLPPEGQEAFKKEQKTDTGFTAQDASNLARIASGVTNDYLFTSDTDKAVLVQKSFVGTEKTDGFTANHYKVGINNDNSKKYCQALVNAIMSSDSYKKLPWVNADTLEKDKTAQLNECLSSTNDVKADDTFDMWIDKRTKLIHKIRIEDDKVKGNYTEIGQNYKGGDTLPLFLIVHSDKDKYNVEFDLDVYTKTGGAKGSLNASYDGDTRYTFKASLEFKPYEGNINASEPAGAIPIQKVFKKLGFDPLAEAAAVEQGRNDQAQDAKKKSDINAIYAQAEVFFATNGYYPSLAQVNDSNWRQTNLQGFDDSFLGSAGSLAGKATKTKYGYTAGRCSGQKCQTLVLTAMLDTGGKFIKTGSNN